MITDKPVIKFSNEQVRPVAEDFRNLYYTCKAIQADWFNGINTDCPNDAEEILEDGRDAEGINQLSGADITNMITQVGAFVTAMEQSGVLDVISKPCVRPFRGK